MRPARAAGLSIILQGDIVPEPITEAFRPKASIIGLDPGFKPIIEALGLKTSIIVFTEI